RSRAKSKGATTPMPCWASSSGPTASVGSKASCAPTDLGRGSGVAQPLAAPGGAPDVVARLGHPVETVDARRGHVSWHRADVPVEQQVVASVEDGQVDHAREGVDVLLFFEPAVQHAAGE